MQFTPPHAVARNHGLSLCLSVIACCIISTLLIKRNFSEHSNLDPYGCGALKSNGRWCLDSPGPRDPAEAGHWQPEGCMLHEYTQHDIKQCLKYRAIVFVGDSAVRRVFWAIARKTDAPRATDMEAAGQKHTDTTFEHEDTKLGFVWDPYLNASSSSSWLGVGLNSYLPWNGTSTAAVIFSSGLWYAKYIEDQYLDMYRSRVRSLTDALYYEPQNVAHNDMLPPAYRSQASRVPIFLPVIQPDIRPGESRSMALTAERLDPMNHILQEEAASGRIELFKSFDAMARDHSHPFKPDKLHLSDHLTSVQANMLLNFLCNSQMVMRKTPYDMTCCNIAPAGYFGVYFLAGGFVGLLLLAAGLRIPWLSSAYQKCRNNGSAAGFVVLALAVAYCFAADRSSLFEKVNKPVNLTAFVFLSALGLTSGFATASRLSTEILPSEKSTVIPSTQRSFFSRQQSEEWKGWMQLLILLYHYFGMSKVLWVYQVARLLVASYLFMTGFGHTTYFLKTKALSMHRVVAVLVRLNMLSCILSYVMLTSYDFYYFSVLCSFWFVVIFCTLHVGFGGDISPRGIVLRCVVSIICVNGFLYIPGLLEGISTALHLLLRADFHDQEFRFRVGLDLYIVYVGILVGWLYHKRHDATLFSWLDSNFRQTGRIRWAIDNEAMLYSMLKATCVAILLGYLLLIACFSDKYQYNKLHPWISPMFVLAYVALRNSSKRLRETHSPIMAWLGRCSLETYILQCHIWLAGDTKGLLRLGLLGQSSAGNLIEGIIITGFFFWTSWHVSNATNALTTAIMGSKNAASPLVIARQLAIMVIVLVVCNWAIYGIHVSL